MRGIYHSLLADIKSRQCGGTSTLEAYYNKQIDWLKSLKQRITQGLDHNKVTEWIYKNWPLSYGTFTLQVYDKLRSELWNLLYKYVKTHNIRTGEEFQDFMLKNDGDVAIFFINEYGEPSLAYHSVKIEDLIE